jgi:hypothetical protein
MEQNNNNGQGGQVPDYRFQEMQQQMRQMEQQNMQLRQMLDQVMLQGQQRQQVPQEEQSPFDDKVDQALKKRFQQLLQPELKKVEYAVGALTEENDMLRFSLRYGQDKLEKYNDKIERLRQDRQRAGQWVSREDAYKHIYFEETNRKAQPNPQAAQVPAQTGPIYDPYTGQMINPPGMPAQSPLQPAPPAQAPQAPQQQWQQAPQAQAPQQQEEVLAPVLPPAGFNPAGANQGGQRQGQVNIGIESGSQDLDAWADKFGDVPL